MAADPALRMVATSRRIRRLTSREGWVALGSAATITVLSWTWIVAMARDMSGAMDGPAEWMMTARWNVPHVALLFAMWSAMMIAMMLPSAAPLIVRCAALLRRHGATHAALRIHAFVTGYLAVWIGFGALAAAVQLTLTNAGLLTPMMEASTTSLAVGLLLAAAAFQLLPIKRRCLTAARLPSVLAKAPRGKCPLCAPARSEHGRAERGSAAFRAGLTVGRSCLASNGVMMLLLFAAGVMNLVAIVSLTAVVLIEKTVPFGTRTTLVSGGVLAALAVWMIAR
jgi:predicted metal-binding membrane protein